MMLTKPPSPACVAAPEYVLSDPLDREIVARALGRGMTVAHGFGNFYVISTRPHAATVRRVNLIKGRPAHQVGSVTTTRAQMAGLFDWSRLPEGLTRASVHALMDDLFDRGPFGFRGPAAAHMPDHLTFPDGGVRTTQLIAPGYDCPSNMFLARALADLGGDYLYITSANRSRHLTGAEDEPAHWQADGIEAEFGGDPGFLVLRHDDEEAARRRYPRYAPMSTTILAFHRLGGVDEAGRPRLIVERHGSLPVEDLRRVVERHGFGLALGSKATRRLVLREYLSEIDGGTVGGASDRKGWETVRVSNSNRSGGMNDTYRIGLIVPSSNTTMETEIPAMLRRRELVAAEAFTVHSSRMAMRQVTPAELARMDRESDRCTAELADARCDALAYACLVAIMAAGPRYHATAETRLTRVAAESGGEAAVVTSAGALVRGIQALGARRVALIAPYLRPLTETVVRYLEDYSIEVVDAISLEIADNVEVGRLDPMQLVHLANRLRVGRADAVVLSACVQMPSLPAIQIVEDRLGLPVLSAATATAQEILTGLGLEPKVARAGRLLATGLRRRAA